MHGELFLFERAAGRPLLVPRTESGIPFAETVDTVRRDRVPVGLEGGFVPHRNDVLEDSRLSTRLRIWCAGGGLIGRLGALHV